MTLLKSSEQFAMGWNSRFSSWRSNPVICNVIWLVFVNLIVISDCVRENAYATTEIIDVAMPGVRPTQDDHYLCTSVNIESRGTQYIYKYEPNENAVADKAHHMLLFTCDDVSDDLTKDGWWDCGHHYNACNKMRIIYAWAKNAPPTVLPKDVGFRIGVESNIKNLVLQVHYAHPLPEGTQDHSGFKVFVTPEEPRYLAGIMLLFRYQLEIPPKTDKIHGDINCPLESPAPIHPFAYRVHTHKLGVVVSGYKIDHTTGFFQEIGKGNPQWPQAFYPIKDNITIQPTDFLAARCTFSTTNFDKATRIGQTAGDEMCNMYLMFYTQSRDPDDHYLTCGDERVQGVSEHLPKDSDVPLPRNATLEEHAMGHHSSGTAGAGIERTTAKSHAKKRPGASTEPGSSDQYTSDPEFAEEDTNRQDGGRKLRDSEYQAVATWPDSSVKLGQASGVDFDTEGNVVVFHRGDRVWGGDTFDQRNNYRQRDLGPIKTDTILIIHPQSGKILHQWGRDMFYMPHDITVDHIGNFWLTDVALHQVFKFEPGKDSGPSLTLGTKFEPGKDDSHFCKPAAVAVMSNGDFFVADGYCNSRIIKFNSKGEKILQWGRDFQPNLFTSVQSLFNRGGPPPYSFRIPHALALAEDRDMICVADRENGRIQCFKASTGKFDFMIDSPSFGGRLFSVAYSSANGGNLYAVNGPNAFTQTVVQGFVIPLNTRKIASVFKPTSPFGNPHDVAVSKDGNDIYVVEITPPYKVWKFSSNVTHRAGKGPAELQETQSTVSKNPLQEPLSQSLSPSDPLASSHVRGDLGLLGTEKVVDDSFGASVIIMAFLTIPLLLMIGIGALMRLRSSGWFRRKETKSFAEFFPPSAGFEKLRMDDDSGSDNSDTEVEEFAVSSYRKAKA